MWHVIFGGRCVSTHDTREGAAQHADALNSKSSVTSSTAHIERARARRR